MIKIIAEQKTENNKLKIKKNVLLFYIFLLKYKCMVKVYESDKTN